MRLPPTVFESLSGGPQTAVDVPFVRRRGLIPAWLCVGVRMRRCQRRCQTLTRAVGPTTTLFLGDALGPFGRRRSRFSRPWRGFATSRVFRWRNRRQFRCVGQQSSPLDECRTAGTGPLVIDHLREVLCLSDPILDDFSGWDAADRVRSSGVQLGEGLGEVRGVALGQLGG